MSIYDDMRTRYASDDTFVIASLYGLGDLYLVASLCRAFRDTHCRGGKKLTLMVKQSHESLARMFSRDWDTLVALPDHIADSMRGEMRSMGYESRLTTDDIFVAHPDFVRVRPDHCVAVGQMTDAAMYALILGLDPRSYRTVPTSWHKEASEVLQLATQLGVVKGKTAVVFPKANSWPDIHQSFWSLLTNALEAEGWRVLLNDPAQVPLDMVLPLVAYAGWAIGANSGIMQMIVQSRVECRKTVLTRELENYSYPLPVHSAFPYRRFEHIDGRHYDIEEYCITDRNWPEVADKFVARGYCARGMTPDTVPQLSFDVPLSPGEVLDRHAVLLIKRDKLPSKAHMIYRELDRLDDARDLIIKMYPEVIKLEHELYELNVAAWDNNQDLFDIYAADEDFGADAWEFSRGNYDVNCDRVQLVVKAFRAAGIEANQARVRLKNRINAICGSCDREQKSYET